MTDCARYMPFIGARQGELSAADAEALGAHMAGCEACRRWAAELAITEGLVSEALAAAAARRDFAPFVDGVMERVAAARPAPWLARARRAVRLHPRLLIGGALVPVLAVMVTVLYLRTGSTADLADASPLEVSAEGATTIIQSSDGPVVLIDDDDNPT